MKESIINYFLQLQKYKVTFTPAIRIKPTPHSNITWIDDMYQVSESFMVTVSTRDDDHKKNLNNLTPEEMQSLNTRLWSMVQDQNKAPVSGLIAKHDPKVKAVIIEKIKL